MAVINFAADSTTLVLNGYAFTSFVSGDIMELAPVNDLTSHVNSTNGGVNIQKRSDGDVHTLTIRVQRFSDDDVFMNTQINQTDTVVFAGSLKNNFTRDSIDGVESWVLEAGSITTRPTEAVNDQDGNALMEYVVMFRTATRSL